MLSQALADAAWVYRGALAVPGASVAERPGLCLAEKPAASSLASQQLQVRPACKQGAVHAYSTPSRVFASTMPSPAVVAEGGGKWTGLQVAYQARLPGCACASERSASRSLQGVPGAYSEQASLLAYESCTPAPFDQFEHAFEVRSRRSALAHLLTPRCRLWSSSWSTVPCCPSRTRSGCAPRSNASWRR